MNTKEIEKNIAKKLPYYNMEQFAQDAQTYINAIREGRMICVIKSVSKSGMSRVLSFHSIEKGTERHWARQYNCLFIALGYTESRNRDGFTIGGCGMDMVFHTNYTIIYRLESLGYITKEECDKLAQQTPVVF